MIGVGLSQWEEHVKTFGEDNHLETKRRELQKKLTQPTH